MLGPSVRSSVGILSLTLSAVRVPSSAGVDAVILKCLSPSELLTPAPLELLSLAPSELLSPAPSELPSAAAPSKLPSPSPSELPFPSPSELVPRPPFEVVALVDAHRFGLVPPLGLGVCVHSWNVFVVACCRAVVHSLPFLEKVPH